GCAHASYPPVRASGRLGAPCSAVSHQGMELASHPGHGVVGTGRGPSCDDPFVKFVGNCIIHTHTPSALSVLSVLRVGACCPTDSFCALYAFCAGVCVHAYHR